MSVVIAVIGSTGVAVASRPHARADTVVATSVRHRETDRRSTTPIVHPRTPGQTVVVTVPSIVAVHLDRAGHILDAATNSGRPPAPGDLVYVVRADGSYEPADIVLAGRRWKGDFSTSMAFQRQARGDGDDRDD